MNPQESKEWIERTAGIPLAILTLKEDRTKPGTTDAISPGATFVPYKLFMAAELTRGHCTIRNASFRFYQDGSTHWDCKISSTHRGDTWHGTISGGDVRYDGNGPGILFYVQPEYEFNIHDANVVKNWAQNYGSDRNYYLNGLPETYRQLQRLVFYCRC